MGQMNLNFVVAIFACQLLIIVIQCWAVRGCRAKAADFGCKHAAQPLPCRRRRRGTQGVSLRCDWAWTSEAACP